MPYSEIIDTLLTPSAELFIFVGSVVVNIFLATVVLLHNRKSATNLLFFSLCVATAGWLLVIGIQLNILSESSEAQLLFARIGILFAAFMSAFFYLLADTIPHGRMQTGNKMLAFVLIATALMAFFNVSPLALTSAHFVGGELNIEAGWGLIPFAIFSTYFSIEAVYTLVRKVRRTTNEVIRRQLTTVLGGLALMLLLITATVLVPLVSLRPVESLSYVSAYTLIFLGATAYSIVRYHLFNIKVILAQAFTIIIWIILFAKIFSNETLIGSVVDILALVFTLIAGFFLIRSVKKEIEQKERNAKLAAELQDANERLQELDKMKTEFLSLATHQIRSPLTAIKGYASMIMEGDFGRVPKKVYYAAKTIVESTQGLVKVVQDFLDISRLEQGRMKYDMEEVDLKEAVERTLRGYRPNIEEAGLTAEFHVEDDTDYTVSADRSKIRQVIGNLIDNAIKYTPKGSITVDLTRAGDKVRLSVSDTGVGMKPKEVKNLFQKFGRTEDAFKTNVSGTGLGLYVARKMIEAMGGKIWAESEGKQKGSTFTIEMKAVSK